MITLHMLRGGAKVCEGETIEAALNEYIKKVPKFISLYGFAQMDFDRTAIKATMGAGIPAQIEIVVMGAPFEQLEEAMKGKWPLAGEA